MSTPGTNCKFWKKLRRDFEVCIRMGGPYNKVLNTINIFLHILNQMATSFLG